MSENSENITALLNRLKEDDTNAVEVVYPLVYDHLREEAHLQLRRERRGHTLKTTALVHEAYLKLIDQDKADFHNQAHFLAIAALAMRRILISYARKRNAEKRGGKETPVTFEDGMSEYKARAAELLDLDDALDKLEKMNKRQAEIVQYRFFGGLTYKEIAQVVEDTEHSVRYDWRVARAWLKREMSDWISD